MPWLLGILANRARRVREGRRAIAEPSAELADARADDPATAAAEAEFRSALERALAHVPATYREVLASHLGDGHAPEEIARRLGRAPGTVRVQLHRGFRQLRRLLPASFAFGAAALLAPRGLAAVRAEVLRAARGAPAPAPSTALVSLGGILVAKKLALVALAFVVALCAWWLARGGERAEQPTTLAAIPPESALTAGRELAPIENAERRLPSADPVSSTEPESAEPYGALTVELTWWDGTPATGMPLCFYPWGERQPVQLFQVRTTDAGGRARVNRIHAGEVSISLERLGLDGSFRAEVESGQVNVERITLPRNCDIVGRVLDRSGAPVAGAQLWVKEGLTRPGHAVERSEDDGSFRVRSVPEGFGLLATASGLGSSDTVEWVELESIDASTRRVELQLRGESAELAGTVTDPSGKPLADARVSVRCVNTKFERTMRYWPFVRSASDAQGTFHIGGLHVGGAEVLVAAAGFALRRETVTLEEGRTTRLAVTLEAGFEVRGTIRLGDGKPGAGAGVNARQYGLDVEELYGLYTAADETGTYVLEHVPSGTAVLPASSREPAVRAQVRLTGRTGDRLAWNVTFGTGPSIRGRARDAAGNVLAGWSVRAYPSEGRSAVPSDTVRTDERGAFVIPDLADALYYVHLYAPGDESESTPRAKAEPLLPDGPEIELVVQGEREASAFLLGRVLDPDGKPIRPRSIEVVRKDGLYAADEPERSEDERFRIGPMFAGEYDLSINLEAEHPSLHRALVIAEGEQRDLGDVQLPRYGEASLTLRGPDGGPIVQPASLFVTDGRYAHRLASTDGFAFDSGPLWPGTYALRVLAGSAVPDPPVSIEVRPGEMTRAEIRFAVGRTVLFDFVVPEGERLPRRLALEVRDAAGALHFEQDPCWPQSVEGHEILMAIGALPFGRLSYAATSPEGWSAKGSLDLAAGPELHLRVAIPLVRER